MKKKSSARAWRGWRKINNIKERLWGITVAALTGTGLWERGKKLGLEKAP